MKFPIMTMYVKSPLTPESEGGESMKCPKYMTTIGSVIELTDPHGTQ